MTRFTIELRSSEGWRDVAYFPTRERAVRRVELLRAKWPHRIFRIRGDNNQIYLVLNWKDYITEPGEKPKPIMPPDGYDLADDPEGREWLVQEYGEKIVAEWEAKQARLEE